MTKRYKGTYSNDPASQSPDAAPIPAVSRFRNQRARRVRIGARAMFLAPLPMLFAGIGEIRQGDAIGTVVELGTFAVFMLAAWLLAEGLKAEDAYDARKIARPPALPRKILAAELCGLGVFLAVWLAAGQGLIAGVLFGLVANFAHLAAFGIDPLRKKGMSGTDSFASERAARAIAEAEVLVAEIAQAAERIGERKLETRIEHLVAQAREMFRLVEEDPRDLPRARKFLSVYLLGARDATQKFAEFYSRSRDAKARADFEALLGDLETSFTTHRSQLLLEDRSDLDIEIEVLRERLKQEGLTA